MTHEGSEQSVESAERWAVATGTIVGSPDTERGDFGSSPTSKSPPGWEWEWSHEKVQDTVDGGLSVWINASSDSVPINPSQATDTAASTILPATCHCGNVRYHITRPDESSKRPWSPFSDLEMPFCRTDASIVKNPSDVKWWLRGEDKSRYLAGTCACRSCRLASGFEIQTWAFIPRSNIFLDSRPSSSEEVRKAQALDFDTVPPGTFRSYESSPGVVREFCPRCGATVFWHNKERPELIDVSVGLLEASEGARAQSWLEWWTERVSFAEEAGAEIPQPQMASLRAHALIESLEHGLRRHIDG